MNKIKQEFFQVILFLAYLLIQIQSLVKPQPKILATLKLNDRAEFQKRVIKEFPLGSSVVKLKQNLKQQNFKLAKNQNCATYRQLCFLGDIYYIIRWQTSDKDKIFNLEVEIISICV